MMTSRLTTRQQLASIWHLGGLTVCQLSLAMWNEIIDGDISSQASGLAFNFILALFPLLFFFVSLFGLFASRGSQLSANLFLYLSRMLPPSAFHLVNTTILEVVKKSSSGKVTLGIITALWFASGGMSSIISALNAAYGVHDRRSWVRVRVIALILTIAISLLTISALFLVLVGDALAGFLKAHVHFGALMVTAAHLLEIPAALLFVAVSFSLIYFYGPDLKEQHWYWITPGSLLGVVLWLLASLGFRAYLHFFNSYGRTYGSLGAVIVLLIWLYVTGFAFLLGGKINAEIEQAAAENGHPEAKARGERKAA